MERNRSLFVLTRVCVRPEGTGEREKRTCLNIGPKIKYQQRGRQVGGREDLRANWASIFWLEEMKGEERKKREMGNFDGASNNLKLTITTKKDTVVSVCGKYRVPVLKWSEYHALKRAFWHRLYERTKPQRMRKITTDNLEDRLFFSPLSKWRRILMLLVCSNRMCLFEILF